MQNKEVKNIFYCCFLLALASPCPLGCSPNPRAIPDLFKTVPPNMRLFSWKFYFVPLP